MHPKHLLLALLFHRCEHLWMVELDACRYSARFPIRHTIGRMLGCESKLFCQFRGAAQGFYYFRIFHGRYFKHDSCF